MNASNEATSADGPELVDLVAELVSAYVSNNRVPPADLPALIATLHAALAGLTDGTAAAGAEPAIDKPTPAQVRKSITPDALISFVDGRPYKTLKRHLSINGLTVEAYRARYGLPRDYPSVAASYAEARSRLAREIGLGRKGGAVAPEPAPAAEAAPEPAKPRGRPRKAEEAA